MVRDWADFENLLDFAHIIRDGRCLSYVNNKMWPKFKRRYEFALFGVVSGTVNNCPAMWVVTHKSIYYLSFAALSSVLAHNLYLLPTLSETSLNLSTKTSSNLISKLKANRLR